MILALSLYFPLPLCLSLYHLHSFSFCFAQLLNGGGALSSIDFLVSFILPLCSTFIPSACMSGNTTDSSHQGEESLMGRVGEKQDEQHWVKGKVCREMN